MVGCGPIPLMNLHGMKVAATLGRGHYAALPQRCKAKLCPQYDVIVALYGWLECVRLKKRAIPQHLYTTLGKKVAEAEKAALSSLTPLTILLVEDSPEDRAVYQRFLRQHLPAAAVCLEAATGTEGLRLCQTARPDCIILDMRLPDMTGLEFLQARQAGAPTLPCPVILLTGQGNEQLAVQALHAGAQDYVVKHDLSAALLYQTITQAMETFRQRQAQETQWHTLRQQNLRLREHEEHLTTLATTLEQQVVERTALLELLQDITRAANEATESAEALQFAVDRLCAYTGWPVGHVYLAVAPDMTRWAPTAIWHLAALERFTAFQQATQSVEFAGRWRRPGRSCGRPRQGRVERGHHV